MADNDGENKGHEDLTEPNVDGAQTDPDGDSSDASVDGDGIGGDSASDEGDDDSDVDLNATDDAATIASLEATIALLQTDNSLKDKEIEKWKAINLQLLFEKPNDATIGTEDEDVDGDDPAPYTSVSGADSLFETKDK